MKIGEKVIFNKLNLAIMETNKPISPPGSKGSKTSQRSMMDQIKAELSLRTV
jgi:hypothetical protein